MRISPREQPHSIQQKKRDRQVERVPGDAVQESRSVRARHVEHLAGHPAAERHAEKRAHDDQAHARARFRRREMLADDDRVRRHDAALEEPEQSRDHVERNERIEGHEEQQRHALKRRPEQERAQAADAIADRAGDEPARDAEREHDREHLRAARGAVTQVRAYATMWTCGIDIATQHATPRCTAASAPVAA